jgi:hypothetical protein
MQQNQVRRKSSGQTEMTVASIWLEGKSHHGKKNPERKHKYPKTEGKQREFKHSEKEQKCIKAGNYRQSL